MATVKTVLIILEVLLLFNLLIGVHELGHFLAAKWRGLKIDRFAIWFGKPLWKRRIHGVEYALGWIPAGGYVALPQMATMEAIEGKSEDAEGQPLPPISAMDKIIVAFAGPLFSFLLAIAFAFIVWGVGKPEQSAQTSTTIGWSEIDGPAWRAGLRPGDEILEVDGHPVTRFMSASQDSITWRVITSEGTNIPIKYVRQGETNIAYPVPYKRPTRWYERKALRQVLIGPAFPAVVGWVATNSPAALAGLTTNDQVIAVDGKPIYSHVAVQHAENLMTNGVADPVTLTIRRGDSEFQTSLVAAKPLQPPDAPPSFGIVWKIDLQETLVHPGPFDQIKESAGQIFATIRAVASKKSDVGFQQLGGALMIVRAYKNFFESENGWRRVLWFSVVLNVNLALLNLLPFPVLDGGHITLALIEAVRRRPVSARLLQYLQTSCALVLIGFMLFIAFFDAGDWVRSARADRIADQPVVFAPKQ